MFDEGKYVNNPPDNPAINRNLANELRAYRRCPKRIYAAKTKEEGKCFCTPLGLIWMSVGLVWFAVLRVWGGGVDRKERPLFSSLEASKPRHMTDEFQDMHPPDGPLRRAFKEYINVDHRNGPGGVGGVGFP